MVIVVGTTLAGWKVSRGEELAWLRNAEAMQADHPDTQFFAAVEMDARGISFFGGLQARLDEIGGAVWTFSYDDGAARIDGTNRLRRICAGRNMVTEYALSVGAEYVLFLDSDMTPPGDCLSKLLDVDWPIVGGDVPSYCLSGLQLSYHPTKVWLEGGMIWPRVHKAALDAVPFGYPVEQHWNTAGFLLVHRQLFRRLRWRTDLDVGCTDDPCYAADAAALGWPTLVRKDVVGKHDNCAPIDQRGADLAVYR